MAFSINGYVLEPPRVGQSNSPFTITPNDFISDPTAFGIAYPSTEANPRDDYLVLVTSEGSNGLLVNAGFGWTKNEVVARFDYEGRSGIFKPLPGGAIVTVGPLAVTSNTQRLQVPPPLQLLAAAPFRLSIGIIGSGQTQTVNLVLTDANFGSPPPGTTELSQATGNLNWNTADLSTYAGQMIRFQQQSFFAYNKSTGRVGTIGDPTILLNPIPGPGQFPLIRIGYARWLLTVEKVDEAHFTAFPGPPSGTVEWADTTGKLNFNATDITNNAGRGVYYDGSLFARDLPLPRQSIGTVNSPTSISGLPPAGGDLIFALPSSVPYHQFPQFTLTTTFDSTGQAGTVQVNPSTGAVQFSASDRSAFGSQPVEVVFGDLPIEHGVSMRFFRTPVNLDASGTTKDVTTTYAVTNAVWQSPIIGSPQVFLPSVPIDDNTLIVTANQSQGTFVGTLPRLDVPSPPAGLGYFINFDQRILQFAQRKNQILIPIVQPSGALQLPDSLLLSSNIALAIETGPGTNVFTPLTPGVDSIIDATAGQVFFSTTTGVNIDSGDTGSIAGTTFLNPTASFVVAGVHAGDFLVVESGAGKGVFTITAVPNPTHLTLDVAGTTSSNLAYEILRGKEILADRFFASVQLVDPTTTVERIRTLGTIANASTIVGSGSATFPDLNTLSDTGTDFVVAGVQPGDTIRLTSGPDSGDSFVILVVTQHQLTPSRSFQHVTAATYTITRRFHIPIGNIAVSRFRYGQTTFSTATNTVTEDSLFSSPSSLPAGTVEVSSETGNLNFSQADVTTGGTVYWSRKLSLGIDVQFQPALSLVQFTDRLLTQEEALITYTTAPPITDPPTPPAPPQTERATFIVRKELTQPHPSPTSVLSFNPTGKPVASNPPPKVFRGGRPQVTGTNCTIDTTQSTITFLPDAQLTDALPHGAVVNPIENVYIDYFIYQAMGGEKTFSVLNGPMLTAQVNIVQGTTSAPSNSFLIVGDQRAQFPAGFLLRIETSEIYMLAAPTYDAVMNVTTVNLAGSQQFQTDFTNPNLFVSSGPIRISALAFLPAYFVPEFQPFDPIARGSNKITIPGDRTAFYKSGTVLYLTDGATSFTHFIAVSGASFNTTTGKTEITTTSNALRQYVYGSQLLFYSVRPVFEANTTTVQTGNPPISTQPITVIRRIEGQVGQFLSSPQDYTIDQTGVVKYALSLQPSEEFAIFYTGHRILAAGPRLQASYTSIIAPTTINGLLGQILNANYSIFQPDNFYFRVETLTNFKGEVAAAIQQQAQSGAPSSGPMTSNASSPQLSQQGRESVFFQEGHIANEDFVARQFLQFFNTAVNDLEDALHALDGRVVGDHDGRFKFDAVIGRSVASPPAALNQIDDLVLVSPFPLPDGTRQALYILGPYSRFFKNRRNLFTTSPAIISGSGHDGDVIAKLTFSNLSSLPSTAFKRFPRAQVQYTYPPGTTTFVVDNSFGTNDALQRPRFVNQMRVVVEDPTHTGASGYIQDSAHVTVTSFSAGPPQTITLSAGSSQTIPAGSTIYVAPSDANSMFGDGADPPPGPSSAGGAYMMVYPFGKDVDANLGTGEILYIKRKFPFDGTLPTLLIPKFFYIFPVQPGDTLQVNGAGVSVTDVAPYKFPALYGGTTDDDGDQAVPIVGPTFDGELTPAGGGPLNSELLAYQTSVPGPLGQLYTITTPPYRGTGGLDVTKTIITDTNASFPSPVPKVNDLVRILDGLNGATSFHRISAVGVNTVTVDSPFTVVDSNFHYTVTVSSTTITGTAILAGTALNDPAGTFTTNGTTPGFTVVMTSGPNLGHRRQVVSITDATDIVIDVAFPFAGGGTYRIDNPLDTFNGFPYTLIAPALAAEIATVGTAEQNALFAFFTTVFTTKLSSVNGAVLIGNLSQLADTSVDFVASGIPTSDLVYIQTGTQAGVFKIASIDDAHHLTISVPFPGGASTGISYQIVSAYGASFQTFQDLFNLLTANTTFLTQTQTFQTLWTTSVPVNIGGTVDASAFAYGVQTADLQARAAVATARLNYLSDPAAGPIAKIQNVLKASDKLYDKRFVWIDARLNQQSGLLIQETRAVTTRISNQQDTYNQLTKLLAIQGL